MKRKINSEKIYSRTAIASKLRRLAECLERDETFNIQVAGKRVAIPPDAIVTIEHERNSKEEEIEFEIKWKIEK